MNTKVYEMRINRDLDKTKKDLAALRNDAVIGLTRRFEQLADGPKKKAAVAVKTLNKSIGQGLNQYNESIQDVMEKAPGNIGQKALKYPWVAISFAMVLGLVLGASIKIRRRPIY